MKTIKVSEATNIQLDWLVDNIEGVKNYGVKDWLEQRRYGGSNRYCTDWSQGGPIIEREGINLSVDYQDDVLSADMVQIGWKGNLWNNSVPKRKP